MNIAFGIALQNDPVTPANLDWFFQHVTPMKKYLRILGQVS
mgnify:CR=1 FL=1